MGRLTETMRVRLAKRLWTAGAAVPADAPNRAQEFYLAQSDAARSFLAEEIQVYIQNRVEVCVEAGHVGARAATERSSAAPCRVCAKDVRILRTAASLIDLERH